jgi:hypothetical protein
MSACCESVLIVQVQVDLYSVSACCQTKPVTKPAVPRGRPQFETVISKPLHFAPSISRNEVTQNCLQLTRSKDNHADLVVLDIIMICNNITMSFNDFLNGFLNGHLLSKDSIMVDAAESLPACAPGASEAFCLYCQTVQD